MTMDHDMCSSKVINEMEIRLILLIGFEIIPITLGHQSCCLVLMVLIAYIYVKSVRGGST